MFLFELLIMSVAYFAAVGIDLVSFFIIVRMVVRRWPKGPLPALDRVGAPITDWVLEQTRQVIPVGWTRGEQHRRWAALAFALAVLAVCRLVLSGLVRWVAAA
jgi:hypothetical protein